MRLRRNKKIVYSRTVMDDPILRRFCVEAMPPSEIDKRLGKPAGTAYNAIVSWWYDDMMRYTKGWS